MTCQPPGLPRSEGLTRGMLGELMTEVASADIAYYVMDALHLWLDGCFSARNKDPIDSHAWLHMTGLGLQWHRANNSSLRTTAKQ